MAVSKKLQGYGLDQDTIEEFRGALYQMHPDFGNYGKAQKRTAVTRLLGELVPNFLPTLNMEYRQSTIQDLLEALGEDKTYSVGEFGWPGAAKTYYWVDPKEDVIGLLLAQYLFGIDLPENTFRVLTYQALLD